MKKIPRYGVVYPNGAYTGGITCSKHDAQKYAHDFKATVYEVGGEDDPEVKRTEEVGK